MSLQRKTKAGWDECLPFSPLAKQCTLQPIHHSQQRAESWHTSSPRGRVTVSQSLDSPRRQRSHLGPHDKTHMPLFSIESPAMKETCHNTFHKNLSATVSINKSVLTPHLQEPELWVHHVDVWRIKLRQQLPPASPVVSQKWPILSKNNKKCIRSTKKKPTTISKLKIFSSPALSASVSVCLAFLFRVNRRLVHTHMHTHSQNPSVLVLLLKKWCHS